MSGLAAGILSVGLAVLNIGSACSQPYPSKPIRIFSSPIGTSSDIAIRIIAQGISGPLGQPVIVENRPPVLLPELVAKAAPDGYTLLIAGPNVWISPLLRKVNYDPLTDFAPITVATSSPDLLVVHPSLPVKSVKDLIALAKARPGELNYAAAAVGGSPHLAAELFKSLAGVNIVRIGYQGSDAATIALISGEVQMTFASVAVSAPYLKSGKLKALAVVSAQPSALSPGFPTVASSLPGFEMVSVSIILAPAKTPALIVSRLNQEIVRFLRAPGSKEKFPNAEIIASSPEEEMVMMKSDMARMGKVIKNAGIKGE